MTIENKGKVYASTRFKILGEGEHYSGKVNFSDDEANGKEPKTSSATRYSARRAESRTRWRPTAGTPAAM